MENKKISSREEKLKRVLTGVAIAGGIGVLAFLVIASPDDKKNDLSPSQPPPSPTGPPPNLKQLEGVEFFPDEGQEHVPAGTRVLYKTDPPTSGRHYDQWLPAGVYEKDKIEMERVVHNLEHGNVVIYHNPDQLAEGDRNALLELPKRYPGQWDGVLVISDKGMASPLILTAWRTKMVLPGYDANKIEAFLDVSRGRGPENPVR